MEASHGMAFGTAVMGGKATLKPDTCNMEPETIITALAMGCGFPALDDQRLPRASFTARPIFSMVKGFLMY